MIKQTDLFFFWKNVAVAAVTFAVLSDYLLYPYCFIVKFIHATDFNCICIFYFLFVRNFNFFVVSPVSCEN